jgi:hypothetical protein
MTVRRFGEAIKAARVRGVANLEPTEEQRANIGRAVIQARIARWVAEDMGRPLAADQEGREYFAFRRAEYEATYPGDLARRVREAKDAETLQRLERLEEAYQAAAEHDRNETRRWIAEHGEPTEEDEEEAHQAEDEHRAALDHRGRP